MSDIVGRLRWHREHPVTGLMVLANPDGPEAADEIEWLRAALELFACDCTAKHLCAQPDNCVNYIARAALEGK